MMSSQFRIDPWKRGFQPPSKCPQCKRVNSLVFTGERTESGDHVYKCMNPICSSIVGSPTMYAWCTHPHFDQKLERDIFFTPCVKCPYRSSLPTNRPGGGVCRYLRVRPYEEFV